MFPCMRDFAHQIVYWAIFGGFRKSHAAKTPQQIMTQNTSKDAVPVKDCLFGSQKQYLTSTLPFSQKTVNFRPDFVLVNFQPKNSVNIGNGILWQISEFIKRMDSRRIFKLGGGIDHVTRHV